MKKVIFIGHYGIKEKVLIIKPFDISNNKISITNNL